ncbi:chemotaxis protein CheC [Parachitinimonas caeni]|uniref:Chemotaxis protein CheC n=1 Tax=Parachitinimonas caeni TaxID=3031301 RepID=A0ABT7E089_9NEIS|nr:chemotaxis protein CheC [Parachitinimonas caeni]MDK2125654.1 chemotaxis protein CheC [Parachitinimonas caeni]
MSQTLTSDQKDALQEVTNIAMGQAASTLATILSTFVTISVPRINIPEVSEIGSAISKMVGNGKEVTAVRQSFAGHLRGEAIIIYGQEGCRDLADLMGYDEDIDQSAERELLLDIANVLIGACLNGIADILQTGLTFAPPSIMAERVIINSLIDPTQLTWNNALLVEVNFTLEARNFSCHLVTLMPEDSIERLKQAIDTFMENF